jgi:hypothetical protein
VETLHKRITVIKKRNICLNFVGILARNVKSTNLVMYIFPDVTPLDFYLGDAER